MPVVNYNLCIRPTDHPLTYGLQVVQLHAHKIYSIFGYWNGLYKVQFSMHKLLISKGITFIKSFYGLYPLTRTNITKAFL